MPVPVSDALDQLRAQQARIDALLSSWLLLQRRVQEVRASVEAELGAASLDLARAYLPVLEAAAFSRAERLTGFRGFSRKDPLRAMEREHHVLRQAIANCEADERYQRREYLVGPMGSLSRELAEAQSLGEPWEQECARFEGQEGFSELIASGYDTPAFTLHFWEPAYWRQWAAGDRICAALELSDFGDEVLPAWQKAVTERERWRGEVARIEARVDEVHALVRGHDEAQARIPRLPEIMLEGSQGLLAEHLVHADPALLDSWMAEDPDAYRAERMALRRLAGLLAKRGFLAELHDLGLQVRIDELQARRQKTERKLARLGRPKMAGQLVAETDLDPQFEQKAQSLEQGRDKLGRQVERILAYQDYQRFELSQDPELWWMEMAGKPPGRYLPRLSGWYARHPDPRPQHVAAEGPAVAAVAMAAAAQVQDDLDFVS